MANVDMDRGDRIADLRKKHGWSQDEFADRVGIGRPAMSNIENGSDPQKFNISQNCFSFKRYNRLYSEWKLL